MRKIAFDSTGYTYDDDSWAAILERIERQLVMNGLPSLRDARWEEWDGGCSFEGTDDEVNRVKQILSLYAVAVWEFDAADQARQVL